MYGKNRNIKFTIAWIIVFIAGLFGANNAYAAESFEISHFLGTYLCDVMEVEEYANPSVMSLEFNENGHLERCSELYYATIGTTVFYEYSDYEISGNILSAYYERVYGLDGERSDIPPGKHQYILTEDGYLVEENHIWYPYGMDETAGVDTPSTETESEFFGEYSENAGSVEELKRESNSAMQRFIDETETEPVYAVCDMDGDGVDEIIIRTVWHQTDDEPYCYLIRIAAYNPDSGEYETSHHRKMEMELNDAELHYSKEESRLIQADSYGNYSALYLQNGMLLSDDATEDIYNASPELKYRSGSLYAKYLSFDIEQITKANNYDESLELLFGSVENADETENFPNKYCVVDLNNDEIDEVIIREYSPEYIEGGNFDILFMNMMG